MRYFRAVALTIALIAILALPAISFAHDSDGDLMPDAWELLHPCLNPSVPDGNVDPDFDGMTSLAEYQYSVNLNPCDWDTDNDTLWDGGEVFIFHTDPTLPDSDFDGLADNQEIYAYATDPNNPDSDSDGMIDGWEVSHSSCGLDPLIGDSLNDPDSDGVNNITEFNQATNPCVNSDADGDHMSDAWEQLHPCLSPLVGDSLVDGDTDGLNNITEYQLGLDPCDEDTDNDLLTDGYEVNVSLTDPARADTDNDGLGDGAELNTYHTDPLLADTDGDGLSDDYEINTSLTDPLLADTDGDSLSDNYELNTSLTDPLLADTDGDAMPDGWEISRPCLNPLIADGASDPDNDTKTSLQEYQFSPLMDPCNPDSDGDNISDAIELGHYCLSPINPDTDGDGYGDGVEDENWDGIKDPSETNPCSGIFYKSGPDVRITYDSSNIGTSSMVWTGSEFGLVYVKDQGSGRYDIYFLMISPAGEKLSDELRVSYTSENSYCPELAWSGSEFAVTWTDAYPGNGRRRFYFAAVNGAGDVVTVPQKIVVDWGGDTKYYYYGYTQVVWTGSEYGLAWDNVYGDRYYVFFRRVSAAGDFLGSTLTLPLYGGWSIAYPSLVWTGSEYGVSFYSSPYHGIHLARITSDGSLVGGYYNTIYPTSLNTGNASMAWTGSEFGLSFQPYYPPWGGEEIFFARATASGTRIDEAIRVTYAGGSSSSSSLVWGDSVYGLAWDDTRDGNNEIYFTRLSPTGTKMQPDLRVTYDPAYSYFSYPGGALAWTGSEYALTWQDLREGKWEIYMAFLTMEYHDDRVPENIEKYVSGCMDITKADTDDDSIKDDEEDLNLNGVVDAGETDPCNADSDNDGLPDGWEVLSASCGLDPNVNDADLDPDADTMTNLQEYLALTDPCNADTDGDGLGDGAELNTYHTDPLLADTDGDGLSDDYEINTSRTDPLLADTDDDGIEDGDELNLFLTDPLLIDTDGDTMPDGWEVSRPCLNPLIADGASDPDNDTKTSLQEYQFSPLIDPCNPDSDGDNISDAIELGHYCLSPINPDTDGDGYSDGVEDEDHDGVQAPGETNPCSPSTHAAVRLSDNSSNSWSPSIVWTGSEFGISYLDDRTGVPQTYFNRIGLNGELLGSGLRVSNSSEGSHVTTLAWSGNEYCVVWTDERSGLDQVYFAIVNSAGDNIISTEQVLSDHPIPWYHLYYISVASTGSEFGITWSQILGGGWAIHFQRVSTSGSLRGDLLRVGAPYQLNDPSIAWTGSEFGIAAYDTHNDPAAIWFMRLSSDGSLISPATVLFDDTTQYCCASLVWTGSEYGVSWLDRYAGGIFFGRVDSSGNNIGSERVSPTGYWPSLQWSGEGYGLLWNDDRDGNYENYFTRLSSNGVISQPDLRITHDPDNSGLSDYVQNNLVWTGDEYGAIWPDNRDGKWNIYFAILGSNDMDIDAVPENIEKYVSGCMDVAKADTDNDGVKDGEEDLDHDGIVDTGETNPCEPDSDGDGMTDGWEALSASCGLDPNVNDADLDPDTDAVTNLQEYLALTDPCVADTDGDGLGDGAEINTYLTNPLNPDSDSDGLDDGIEVNLLHTDPNSPDPDSDADHLPDSIEANTRIYVSPANPGTDPFNPDTDGDGINDGDEVFAGSNPLDPRIRPGKVVSNMASEARMTYGAVNAGGGTLIWVGSEYGVTWTDLRDDLDGVCDTETGTLDCNYEVYFARISAAGDKIGSDLRVTDDPNSCSTASMIWTGSEYGLSWVDYRDGNGELYFTRISADGGKIGDDLRMTEDPSDAGMGSMTWTGSEYGLSWVDYRSPYGSSIYFVRISASGSKIGTEFQVPDAPNWDINPSLTWTGSEYGVSWTGYLPHCNTNGFFFARISSDGSKIGTDLPCPFDACYSGSPSLAWTGSEYGVSWQDGRDSWYNSPYSTYFARISASGITIGDEIGFDYGTTGPPSMVWTGTEYGVSWTDYRDGNHEIYFGQISAYGSKIGREVRLTFDPGSALAGPSSLAWAGSEYGVSWFDTRDGTAELYFARIGSIDDSDGDGLADVAETLIHSTDPHNWDTDHDRLSDADEILIYLTNPLVADTDGDGAPDGAEIGYGMDPLRDVDQDGDGLSDAEEIMVFGTDPLLVDSDGDGLTDWDEVMVYLTNPWEKDSDGDGLEDKSEIEVTLTSPLLADTDHDGVPDGMETGHPLTDADGDALPNIWERMHPCLHPYFADLEADPDGDGFDNLAEYQAGTDPCAADTDGDGLNDSYEVNTSLTDPSMADTDGDGLSDGEEVNVRTTDPLLADTDGDGFSDGAEIAAGSDPKDPDSVPAQPARLINYGGRLADSTGVAIGGTVTMRFEIVDTAAGSTVLWGETQTVHVALGLYNVLLGSAKAITPAVFSGPERWLRVTVNGEVMSPRSRITSVPFAIKAEELAAGRMETDARELSVPSAASEALVHVSFKQGFSAPPRVLVSPLSGPIGGEYWAAAAVSNVSATGFDVVFKSWSGGASSGTASFTYQALGQ